MFFYLLKLKNVSSLWNWIICTLWPMEFSISIFHELIMNYQQTVESYNPTLEWVLKPVGFQRWSYKPFGVFRGGQKSGVSYLNLFKVRMVFPYISWCFLYSDFFFLKFSCLGIHRYRARVNHRIKYPKGKRDGDGDVSATGVGLETLQNPHRLEAEMLSCATWESQNEQLREKTICFFFFNFKVWFLECFKTSRIWDT